ncbi:hypothetical protein, partial [Staphylococcus aureus]|uniref:hypothetical protein n=1 Tax=Staphylococcus aureus TaxID=1280 RepID=UPI001C7CFDB6
RLPLYFDDACICPATLVMPFVSYFFFNFPAAPRILPYTLPFSPPRPFPDLNPGFLKLILPFFQTIPVL